MEGLSNIPVKAGLNESKEKQLLEELNTQKQLVKSYEEKFNSLFEDFNYNVQLIYERDREISKLHSKIEELLSVINEKDYELMQTKGLESKIKQLESDKIVLNKRLEAFTASNRYANSKGTGTPRKVHKRSADFSLSKDLNDGGATDRLPFNTNEPDPIPLSRINSDLERRIKALELENQSRKDDATLSADIPLTEKLSVKEKEISELIKSLSPYKKETLKTSKSRVLKSFDLSSKNLIRDADVQSALKSYQSTSNIHTKASSILRCISSLNDS